MLRINRGQNRLLSTISTLHCSVSVKSRPLRKGRDTAQVGDVEIIIDFDSDKKMTKIVPNHKHYRLMFLSVDNASRFPCNLTSLYIS